MDNKMGRNEREQFEGPESGNVKKSPDWSREDELLFNAIQNTSSACDEDGEPYAEIDEDFGDEEPDQDADEQFSSSVRVLTTMYSR
jgi:hypothetical protein